MKRRKFIGASPLTAAAAAAALVSHTSARISKVLTPKLREKRENVKEKDEVKEKKKELSVKDAPAKRQKSKSKSFSVTSGPINTTKRRKATSASQVSGDQNKIGENKTGKGVNKEKEKLVGVLEENEEKKDANDASLRMVTRSRKAKKLTTAVS